MTYSSQPALNTYQKSEGPVGIGGWLILPILHLCGAIILTLHNLYGIVSEWTGIKAIIEGGNDKLVALRLPLAISSILGIAVLILACICLHRLFARSPTVPRLMTFFYMGMVVATLGDVAADNMMSSIVGSSTDPDNFLDVLRVVIAAAIWIPYFHRSRRVANTFRAREAAVDRKIGEVF
ncbi:DUF2569 domain-containing protein [Labrys okinawensis]|uniref:DUF2569 domain-containing protein n=1 Tax=Labrys okinawensis TaxID=346911 RepID=UPI0039BD33E4